MKQLPLTYGSYLRLIKNAPEKFFVNFSGAHYYFTGSSFFRSRIPSAENLVDGVVCISIEDVSERAF